MARRERLLDIDPRDWRTLRLRLVGDKPLIMHRWGPKQDERLRVSMTRKGDSDGS